MPLFRTPEGKTVDVPEADAAWAQSQGFSPISSEQRAADIADAGVRARAGDRGVLGDINAGLTSFASGATLGLSDVGLSLLGTEGSTERLRAERAAAPVISTIGNVAGGILPTLLPGGLLAKTPAGMLGRAATEAVETGRALGGLRGTAQAIGASGAEAAAQSAGSYISDVALGDRDLTAEGMAAALGRGFGFGSVAGGAILGIEKGTMAARRLFSRTAEGGKKAADDAAAAFERASEETLTAHDDVYRVARARLDEIQALKAQAQDVRLQADVEIARAKLDEFRAPKPTSETAPPVAASEAPAAAGDAASPGPAPTTRGAPTRLEDQLAEMKRQVDGGATIQDLNAQRAQKTTEELLGPAIAEEEQKLTAAVENFEQKRSKISADRKDAISAWTSRLKNPRKSTEATAENLAGGQVPAQRSRTTKALDEDVFVEQSGGQLRTIGPKEYSLKDITPNSRILARSNGDDFSRGSQLDEMYDDAIERAALAESREARDIALQEAVEIEQQIHAYVRNHKPENAAVIDAIGMARENAGVTGYEAALKRAESRAGRASDAVEPRLGRVDPEQEQFFQESLRSQGPRGPVDTSWIRQAEDRGFALKAEQIQAQRAKQGLPPLSDDELARATGRTAVAARSTVEDIDDAIKELSEYEKAGVELTEAVGDAAPPKAREHADGYRKAETEVDRKHTDRTARAVDDHADDVAYGPTQRTPKDRIADARAAKLEAEADLARLKLDEAEARKAVKSSRPAPKKKAKEPEQPQTPEPRGSVGAADIGAALEAANTIGIPGLPSPSSIPLVGPLLGAYLKYRALKAVAGRMTGRVAATGDAKAAALAAKTKERVAQSVDRMLGLVERSTPAARNAAVRAGGRMTDALVKRIYDDGEPDAREGASPQEIAAVRIRELANAAANPGVITAQIRRQLRDVSDPDLIAAVERHQLNKIQHLNSVAPKAPAPNPFVKREWKPDPTATERFARRMAVADDPEVALDAVHNGTLTVEQADTLKAVHPKTFNMLQTRLLERSVDMQKTLPIKQRVQMSTLYDVPLDSLMQPDTMAVLQASSSAPAAVSPVSPMQNQAPVPSTAAPVDLMAMYQPESRRAARR